MPLKPDDKCFFARPISQIAPTFLRRDHGLPVWAAGIYPNTPAFLIVAEGAKSDF